MEEERMLTGTGARLERRLATAPSKLAYSSDSRRAIMWSSSSSCWLLKEVELED